MAYTAYDWLNRLGYIPNWFAQSAGSEPTAIPATQNQGFGQSLSTDLASQNTEMMSVNRPELYNAAGEGVASGYSTPATNVAAADTSTATSGSGGSLVPYIGAVIGAVQGAKHAGNVARDIRNAVAERYGVSTKHMAHEPSFLTPRNQQRQEVGIAGASLLSQINPWLAAVPAALRGFKTVKQQSEASKYIAKLFHDIPEFERAGLEAPTHKAGTSEKLVSGGYAAFKQLLGPLATPLEKLSTGPLAGLTKHLPGGGPVNFLKKKQTSTEADIAQIEEKNQSKLRGLRAMHEAAQKAIAAAYSTNPQMDYVTRIMQQRAA